MGKDAIIILYVAAAAVAAYFAYSFLNRPATNAPAAPGAGQTTVGGPVATPAANQGNATASAVGAGFNFASSLADDLSSAFS